MIYWGVDPGPEHCGVACIYNGKPSGVIVPTRALIDPLQPFPFNEVDGLVVMPHRVILGIETPVGMGQIAGREMFETAYIAGRIHACHEVYAHVVRFGRNAIRRHVLGSARGNDKLIRAAMIERWGQPGTRTDPGPTHGITGDAWAALAVATCAYDWKR